MPIGKVKFFAEPKGYGFITQLDGAGDVFVHVSDLRETGLEKLHADQRVSFDVETKRRGLRAVNIKVI